MSDYHILSKSEDSRYARVIAHLPVPATQTVAGTALSDATLTYRRAIKEMQESAGAIESAVPNHATDFTTENGQLLTGEVYEQDFQFRFSNLKLTNPQRRTEIEGGNDNMLGVTQMKLDMAVPGTDLWDEILEPLEWWGYNDAA